MDAVDGRDGADADAVAVGKQDVGLGAVVHVGELREEEPLADGGSVVVAPPAEDAVDVTLEGFVEEGGLLADDHGEGVGSVGGVQEVESRVHVVFLHSQLDEEVVAAVGGGENDLVESGLAPRRFLDEGIGGVVAYQVVGVRLGIADAGPALRRFLAAGGEEHRCGGKEVHYPNRFHNF